MFNKKVSFTNDKYKIKNGKLFYWQSGYKEITNIKEFISNSNIDMLEGLENFLEEYEDEIRDLEITKINVIKKINKQELENNWSEARRKLILIEEEIRQSVMLVLKKLSKELERTSELITINFEPIKIDRNTMLEWNKEDGFYIKNVDNITTDLAIKISTKIPIIVDILNKELISIVNNREITLEKLKDII